MAALVLNLEVVTIDNPYYRNVLYTGKNFQLVLMSIPPRRAIGMEKHDSMTQFIRVESGTGQAKIGDKIYEIQDGMMVIIPPGIYHDIFNTSETDPLQLYTIYNRAEHPAHAIEIATN